MKPIAEKLLFAAVLGGALAAGGCAKGRSTQSGSCVTPGTATQSSVRAIRNGDEPDPCEFGNVVRIDIVTRTREQAICTGTLIAKNVVISAAHCFIEADIAPARQAIITTGGSRSQARVVAYRTHPGYNTSSLDSPDMSILYLDRQMPETPAPIATGTIAVGQLVTALGYGRDGQGADGNGDIGTLLQGTLRIDSSGSTKKNLYAHAADAKSQETCTGDSGGPLFQDGIIHGVLSGGDYKGTVETCRTSANSIFTPLAYYQGWIRQAISAGTQGATVIGQ